MPAVQPELPIGRQESGQRTAPQDLQAAGPVHFGETALERRQVQGEVFEQLGGGQGDGGVLDLVGAAQFGLPEQAAVER